MSNELELYGGARAITTTKRLNYIVTSPITGESVELKRGVDFGMIPKAKQPTLFKAGAEKIVMAYGLLTHYTIESKFERFDDNPLFYYVVRCDLVKVNAEGTQVVFSSGLGSANTAEKRNGFNSAYDSANATLKMAQKRSLVASALNIAGSSDFFAQDLDSETFMSGYTEMVESQNGDSTITAKQVKRLYALGNEAGLNAEQLKNKLASNGYTSTKEITQSQYEEVCKLITEG